MGTTPSLGLSAPAQHLRSGERQHEAAPRPQVLSTLLRTGAGRRWRPEAPGDRPQGDSSWSCGGAAADPARHRSCSRRCRPGAGPDSARFGAPRGWVCVTSAAAPLPQGAVTGPAYGAGPGRLPHPGALNKPAPRGWGCWRLGGAGPEAAPSPLEAPSPRGASGPEGGRRGAPEPSPACGTNATRLRGSAAGNEGMRGLRRGWHQEPRTPRPRPAGSCGDARRPPRGLSRGERKASGRPPARRRRRRYRRPEGRRTGQRALERARPDPPPTPPGAALRFLGGRFPPPGDFPAPCPPGGTARDPPLAPTPAPGDAPRGGGLGLEARCLTGPNRAFNRV